MKRFITVVVLLSILISFGSSCFHIEEPISYTNNSFRSSIRLTSTLLEDDYLVDDNDLEAYVNFLNKQIGDETYGLVLDVEPVLYDGEIAFYIINFEDGWQILSSDKRGPIVLAKSNHGHFSMKSANENILTQLYFYFEDILFRRNNPERYYELLGNKEKEMEEFCEKTWKLIVEDLDSLTNKAHVSTKVIPNEPLGDYQLSYTYYTHQIDSVNHLMSTHWHQGGSYGNYNAYCPLATDTTRCPAGCVTIAGAQVLNYLHYFIGSPIESPTNGFCFGYYYNYNNTSSYFSDYSSSTWDLMPFYASNDYRALFIGHIAKLSRISFSPNSSGTTVEEFYDYALPVYDVTATYSNIYSCNTVFQNLKSGMPVIYGGNKPNGGTGHAWVIDGYVEDIVTIHNVYEWVYLEPPTVPVNPPEPIEFTIVSPAALLYFKMNWGWGNPDGEDDAHYSPSGSWVPGNQPGLPYTSYRELIYNWQSSE